MSKTSEVALAQANSDDSPAASMTVARRGRLHLLNMKSCLHVESRSRGPGGSVRVNTTPTEQRCVGSVSMRYPGMTMNTLAKATFTLVALFVGSAAALAQGAAPPGEWRQLFNGKDLDGWKVKITGHALGDNYGNTFRVEDGVLKVRYDRYGKFDGKFGHLFYHEAFSNYIIRVEYRFVGQQVPGGPGWAFRNSGIMLHGQSPESLGKDQDFPISIEVQLLGGSGTGERPTANVCTPGTHIVMDGKLITRHCNDSSSKTYHGDQWVTVEVEVRGNTVIRHIIEGQTVLNYTNPQLDDTDAQARKLIKDGDKMLYGGTISLQSESHPVDFRKVELLKLPD